jgi:hypothetical protein
MIREILSAECTRPIPMAESFDEVGWLAKQVCRNSFPGFQVRERKWCPEDIARILRRLASVERKQCNDEKLGFDCADAFESTSEFSLPHVDSGCEGLALHLNRGYQRVVQLAHPIVASDVPDKRPFSQLNQELYHEDHDMSVVQDQVAEIYAGQTVPKRLTVFSEGHAASGMLKTVHYFAQGRQASWVRYSGGISRSVTATEDFCTRLQAEHTLDAIPAAY